MREAGIMRETNIAEDRPKKKDYHPKNYLLNCIGISIWWHAIIFYLCLSIGNHLWYSVQLKWTNAHKHARKIIYGIDSFFLKKSFSHCARKKNRINILQPFEKYSIKSLYIAEIMPNVCMTFFVSIIPTYTHNALSFANGKTFEKTNDSEKE